MLEWEGWYGLTCSFYPKYFLSEIGEEPLPFLCVYKKKCYIQVITWLKAQKEKKVKAYGRLLGHL
jgi:hypothetical protein